MSHVRMQEGWRACAVLETTGFHHQGFRALAVCGGRRNCAPSLLNRLLLNASSQPLTWGWQSMQTQHHWGNSQGLLPRCAQEAMRQGSFVSRQPVAEFATFQPRFLEPLWSHPLNFFMASTVHPGSDLFLVLWRDKE